MVKRRWSNEEKKKLSFGDETAWQRMGLKPKGNFLIKFHLVIKTVPNTLLPSMHHLSDIFLRHYINHITLTHNIEVQNIHQIGTKNITPVNPRHITNLQTIVKPLIE